MRFVVESLPEPDTRGRTRYAVRDTATNDLVRTKSRRRHGDLAVYTQHERDRMTELADTLNGKQVRTEPLLARLDVQGAQRQHEEMYFVYDIARPDA